MEKSTVIEILRTFSKEELSKFGDFVSSPYFNKKSNVAKLYTFLRKYSPEFPEEKIKKEEVWKKIFPGKKYNYGIMKNLIYDLTGLAYKFLEQENHSLKPFEGDINIIEQYMKRGLNTLAEKKIETTRKTLAESEQDYLGFYYSFWLENAELSVYLDYEYHSKKKKHDITELNKNLSFFYYSNFFYHNAGNLFASSSVKLNIDSRFHKSIVEQYQASPYKNKLTEMFYHLYKFASEPSDEVAYLQCKKLVFENYSSLTGILKYNIIGYLLNFCKINNMNGNTKFRPEEFEYTRLMIEDGLFRHSGQGWLNQYNFINSIISACRAGKFDWAENFIEKYRHELQDRVKETYTSFAYIQLNIRNHKYDKALEHFSKCYNIDKRDRIVVHAFGLVIYYELNHYEQLKSLVDSSLHMIKNDKFYSDEKKLRHKNFVNAVSKLMDYKINKGGIREKNMSFLPEISEFIQNNPFNNRPWLLERIERLKKERI